MSPKNGKLSISPINLRSLLHSNYTTIYLLVSRWTSDVEYEHFRVNPSIRLHVFKYYNDIEPVHFRTTYEFTCYLFC